jgi:O-antigen/teichoic acid export membrane protein
MTRSKRFVTSLLSSYASIGVNVLYTIASVPLALHYLNKEEFGLWALVTQLSGYLMLLEFGMTGSVARSLSDHKDNMGDGTYGNILRTGGRVFAIQGILVILLGVIIAWFAAPLLNLPKNLQHAFVVLMVIQALLSGAKLAVGSLASPLWCHQRLDLSNLAGSASLVVIFIVLWLGFHLGWHLYSLPIATACGFIVGVALTYFSCRRLGFYPPREHRGKFDPKLFRELFHFGGGLFLMNLGAQLASASQIIVVSRLLGIEAATVWSVSTKIFAMAQQFVARVIDSSAGGLAEMVVRGEHQTFHKRFRDLVSISAVMAVAASAGIALANGPFIEIWTSGKVYWGPWNHLLLGAVLFVTAVTRSHTCLVGITKQIRGTKYIYLIEGVTFVTLAILLGRWMGFPGLLIAALLSNFGITGVYAVTRTASYFGDSKSKVAGWVGRPALILLITSVLFSVLQIPAIASLSAPIRFSIGIIAFLIVIIPSLWSVGLNSNLRAEITKLVSKITSKRLAKRQSA